MKVSNQHRTRNYYFLIMSMLFISTYGQSCGAAKNFSGSVVYSDQELGDMGFFEIYINPALPYGVVTTWGLSYQGEDRESSGKTGYIQLVFDAAIYGNRNVAL